MIRLITLLASGIPAIIAAIISFVTRKVGTAAGSIASFALLTIAFVSCINLIFQAVMGALTIPEWAANGIGMFIPSTFSLSVGAIWSAKTCRAMYDMARFKIKLINSAN